MYNNDLIFTNRGVSRFKKVSVLVQGNVPWEHYENAYVHIAPDYVLIVELSTEKQILLPKESIKVIVTEGKFYV
jgi:hypothetical protein